MSERRPDVAVPDVAVPAALVCSIAVAPLVIAAVIAVGLWGRSWTPMGDWAAMWLRADDVFTVHTPLVGAYSVRNWAHPGPSIFWLVWALKQLSVHSVSRAFAIMAMLNGLALTATVFAARRWFGDRRAVATGLVATVLAHALGGGHLGDFWNPYPPVVWFLAFAVGALAVAVGAGTGAWIWSIVFGSLAAQAHVSFFFLVVIFSAATVVGARAVGRDSPASPFPTRRAVAILVAFWLPVAIDLVIASRNLNRIKRYLTQGHPSIGISDGMHLVAREFAPWVPLVHGGEPGGTNASASALWLLIVGMALACMAVVATRHRRVRLAFIAASAIALSAPVLAAGLQGYVFAYLLTFLLSAAAVFWWLVLMAAAETAVLRRAAVAATLAGVVTVVILSLATDPARSKLPGQEYAAVVRVAASKFTQRVGDSQRPIEVDYLDDEDGLLAPGVIGLLAERYDIRTLDAAARLHKWGYARGVLPQPPFTSYTIIPLYPASPLSARNACILAHHQRVVVSTTALSAAQLREFTALRIANYVNKGRLPSVKAGRYAYLRARAARVMIVEGLFRSTC